MKQTVPQFWRAAALPFIEARSILDGRNVCYSRHAHAHFSIGVITSGHCLYTSGEQQQTISQGTVVLMNPHVVHACNPIEDQPWAYRMLYIDTQWIAAIQAALTPVLEPTFQPYSAILSNAPELFAGFNQFYLRLTDDGVSSTDKLAAAETFFKHMHSTLVAEDQRIEPAQKPHEKLQYAANYIQQHCAEPLSLQQLSAATGLSRSYLIRAFAQHFGMTPHAYLTNQRVQLAQRLLQRGELIADAALASGFADQAHLQRTFKQHLAATPGQYRG